jgi:uncharacterized protein (DUF1697 family)
MVRRSGSNTYLALLRGVNAVVDASPAVAAGLPKALHAAILKKAGFEAPVVLRSAAQMAAVLKANPFLGVARTKLTNAYFDSALKTVCTMRNWRTVLALHALATASPA